MKILKFGTKNVLSGFPGSAILNNYCHIWNQYSQVFIIIKFGGKTKFFKSRTKNTLLGYFGAGIWK